MKHMTLSNIANACGGTLCYEQFCPADFEVTGVVIDSRLVAAGNLFIPVRGTRVDGHNLIPNAIQAGAVCVLSDHALGETTFPYILVPDTLQALKDIATWYRKQLSIPVIGVTGSVGKTSTRKMITCVLAQKYHVLATDGNYNNEIGLPLTILRIRREHQIAVLEMGISDFKEMHRLTQMAQPDFAVITNIGTCHLEHLKDRDGVLRAKTEIFDSMKSTGIAILNGDDDKLASLSATCPVSPYFFTASPSLSEEKNTDVTTSSLTGVSCQAYATSIENKGFHGVDCTLQLPASALSVHISVFGSHMVQNALAAALLGELLHLSHTEIKRGIEAFSPVTGRGEILCGSKFTLINDCYNANPTSVKAALDILATTHGRRVAILGDMLELGDKKHLLHQEIGQYAVTAGIDLLICIGVLAEEIAQGATACKKQLAKEGSVSPAVYFFPTKTDFLVKRSLLLTQGDIVLIKASHSMAFQELVEALQHT